MPNLRTFGLCCVGALVAACTRPTGGDCSGAGCGGKHPDSEGGPAIRVPAEWEPQAAVWMQWPQRWESSYEPAFSRIVATTLGYEDVHLLVNDSQTRTSAETSLAADGGLSDAVIGGQASTLPGAPRATVERAGGSH